MHTTVRSTLSTTTGRRRLGLVAGALIAGTLGLTACSGGDSSSSASTSSATSVPADATFNTADVEFAQNMVPHHQQAIEMAQLTTDRSTNPQVLDLAQRIEAAQGPEIEQLNGWLEDWGQEPADGEMDQSGMGGMDMGGMDMGGMMSEEDMSALEAASGTEFDRMWLTMMIEHHTGAIGMAETEISDGEDTSAVAMAEQIKSSQNEEISEMEQMLQTLPQS